SRVRLPLRLRQVVCSSSRITAFLLAEAFPVNCSSSKMPATSEIHASANDNDKETKVTVTGTQPPSLGHAMGTVVVNSETKGSTRPVRKKVKSNEADRPNMSGGTPAPSEAGSSVQGYESAHERSKQNVDTVAEKE
ncbi:hypothetical protein AAFF_G00040190, partial [Aldrovandia affinis]